MLKTVSKATQQNWQRLNVDVNGKLTRRANKTQSTRRVVASGYVSSEKAQQLLEAVRLVDEPLPDVMFSLCCLKLHHYHLLQQTHVKEAMQPFSDAYRLLTLQVNDEVWEDNNDLLGYIYQSLLTEGERNRTGQYYTYCDVANEMLTDVFVKEGETFFDPCCGSGAFLMAAKTDDPRRLFGTDINPVAVMLTITNLLVKYRQTAFIPHVFCIDFLDRSCFAIDDQRFPTLFDYIYTNPPWGADKEGFYVSSYNMVKSKEKASMFIVQSLAKLKSGGTLHFLLPMSLLKIKMHQDIRRYLLRHSTLQNIYLYDGRFDGVFTGFFSLQVKADQTILPYSYAIHGVTGSTEVKLLPDALTTGKIAFESLNRIDQAIVEKMERKRHDSLSHSQWALGIVTGNNKEKVKSKRSEGMEPVYAGKEVDAFMLKDRHSFIRFSPESFQQCAKEELYRSKEKLIYRFIAKFPIVAYDNQQRLCLNSANILIPSVDGMSVKSVALLLNSSLYRYYYGLKFTDIKVLKGNLQQLPFPKLTTEQNQLLTALVDDILLNGSNSHRLAAMDDIVYNLFNISNVERHYINFKFQ